MRRTSTESNAVGWSVTVSVWPLWVPVAASESVISVGLTMAPMVVPAGI